MSKIRDVYDNFKFFDEILSDNNRLDEKNGLINQILWELWQAIKEAVEKENGHVTD